METYEKVERLETISDELDILLEKAKTRNLTADERERAASLHAEVEALDATLDIKERIVDFSVSTGRKTTPNQDTYERQGVVSQSYGTAARTQPIKGGHDLGELGQAVAESSKVTHEGGQLSAKSQRILQNAAPTTISTEGIAADGGYGVPQDFSAEINQKVMGEQSLLSLCDQKTTTSNTFVFPKDETSPWQSSGGPITAPRAQAPRGHRRSG